MLAIYGPIGRPWRRARSSPSRDHRTVGAARNRCIRPAGRFLILTSMERSTTISMRAELDVQARPQNWRGRSDTENSVAGRQRWGIGRDIKEKRHVRPGVVGPCRKRKLTFARDRFGEKPLYYGFVGTGNESTWRRVRLRTEGASCAARLRDGHRPRRVGAYSALLLVPDASFDLLEIYKLEPGSVGPLNSERGSQSRQSREGSVLAYSEWRCAGLANPIVDEREVLRHSSPSFERGMGPATCRRCAGWRLYLWRNRLFDYRRLDAGAVVNRNVKTFTVGFEESGFDESPYAAAVARRLGTEHHEIHVTPQRNAGRHPELPAIYDEPFADSSQIPTSIICARRAEGGHGGAVGRRGRRVVRRLQRYVMGPYSGTPSNGCRFLCARDSAQACWACRRIDGTRLVAFRCCATALPTSATKPIKWRPDRGLVEER